VEQIMPKMNQSDIRHHRDRMSPKLSIYRKTAQLNAFTGLYACPPISSKSFSTM